MESKAQSRQLAPGRDQAMKKPTSLLQKESSTVPGTKLRINQPAGQEIKSILKNKTEQQHSEEKDERRLSVENLPSVKSKIENYLQQAESAASSQEKAQRYKLYFILSEHFRLVYGII